MLNWIVQNGEIVFAGVVAASTVFYVILTRSLVAETKKLREVQTEPKIAVWVRPKEEAITFAHLYVRNIGLGPAFDVSFEIGEETETPGGKCSLRTSQKRNSSTPVSNIWDPDKKCGLGSRSFQEILKKKSKRS